MLKRIAATCASRVPSGLLFGLVVFGWLSSARAGLGPANVVVVVNAESSDSRTIANHYVELRQIPSLNVIFLSDVPDGEQTNLQEFRERILVPLLREIDNRKLAAQTRVIAYSADFPTAIDIREHREQLSEPGYRKIFTPMASINGLTFFYRQVLADQPSYLAPYANVYARGPIDRFFQPPFLVSDEQAVEAFQEAKNQAGDGEPLQAADHYAQLFKANPSQHPLAILAAEQYQAAGKEDRAAEFLSAAIEAGWTSRRYIEQETSLGELLDDSRKIDPQLATRLDDAPIDRQPPVGFRSDRFWMGNGVASETPTQGIPYLMSVVLAVTRHQGTSVQEAIESLQRAAESDRTYPRGTFYFTATGDVRSTTRKPEFETAIRYLDWLEQASQQPTSSIPQDVNDCLGAVLGTARYSWREAGSTLVAGALVDNLTSLGGVMARPGQTKLSESLRAGAAAASGTVTEPYALQFKFPLPIMQGYYAEGAAAAEAFYLSVASPYQLLIVGDPLCQPFARPPQVQMTTNNQGPFNSKTGIEIRFQEKADATDMEDRPKASAPREIEFFVNGRLAHRASFRPRVRFATGSSPGGIIDLRIAIVGDHRLEPRQSQTFQFELKSIYPTPSLRRKPRAPGDPQTTFFLTARTADEIRLMHHQQPIAQVDGEHGALQIDLAKLGRGPIRLRSEAIYRGVLVPGPSLTFDQETQQ